MESKAAITKLDIFGCSLAMVISWSTNESIIWTMIHGVFGWFYVFYYAITR